MHPPSQQRTLTQSSPVHDFGITMEGAAALRGTVKRNKVASIEISIDEEIAQKFRYTEPN